MIIHAKNIRGLGALVLSKNVISKIHSEVSLLLASVELATQFDKTDISCELKIFKFSFLLRSFELIFKKLDFGSDPCLVLGDIPLKITSKQLVYFHNSNLLYRQSVRDLTSLKLYVNQILFRRNLKYVDVFVVQTRHARHELQDYLIKILFFSFLKGR